jgi:hypothetical protein
VRGRQHPPALAHARRAWVLHPAEAETWLCGESRKIRCHLEEDCAILWPSPVLLDACDSQREESGSSS